MNSENLVALESESKEHLPHIIFMGASCTHQSRDHKTGLITGYVEAFSELYLSLLDLQKVHKITWPGRRFGDLSIALLADALENQLKDIPSKSYCVLELLVEDYGSGSQASLEHYYAVVEILLSHQIIPIFFNLPKGGYSPPSDWGCAYEYILNASLAYSVPVINVCPPSRDRVTEDFYRGVNHTSFEGAVYYAFFLKSFLGGLRRDHFLLENASKQARGANKFHTSSLQLDLGSYEVEVRSLSVRLKQPLRESARITLVFCMTVGQYSPFLDVSIKNLSQAIVERLSVKVWDRYCYYERNTLFPFEITLPSGCCRIDFCVSREIPDYSLSNDKATDYSPYIDATKRFLKFYSRAVYCISRDNIALDGVSVLLNC